MFPCLNPCGKLVMAGNNGRSDHRVFRYSMGSNGVCGGGIAAAAASSSSISMPKVSAISLGFQALSMAILATRRLEGGRHTQSTRRGVWSRHAEEGRKNKGDTRLTGYEKAPSLLFGSKGRVLPIEPHKITLCQVLRMLTNDNDCHQALPARCEIYSNKHEVPQDGCLLEEHKPLSSTTGTGCSSASLEPDWIRGWARGGRGPCVERETSAAATHHRRSHWDGTGRWSDSKDGGGVRRR
uniref:Uncharacterized protein n=1 Tax=Oryza rufipogon TaxID=4529 RepID=A0A0E0R2F3_ORYRU